MTKEEISRKSITFFKHLKSEDNEAVVSGIVPRGDSNKEKAETIKKLLKDTCTEYNMHSICHSNIIQLAKRHIKDILKMSYEDTQDILARCLLDA